MVSPVLTEGRRTGEFMVSESNNARSRGIIIVKNAGGAELVLPAGLVLSTIAADGSAAPYLGTGAIGQQTATMILWDNIRVPAAGQVRAAVVMRDCEVNVAEIQWDVSVVPGALRTTGLAQLASVGIIYRDVVI